MSTITYSLQDLRDEIAMRKLGQQTMLKLIDAYIQLTDRQRKRIKELEAQLGSTSVT